MEEQILHSLYEKYGSYIIPLIAAGAELGLAKQTAYNLNHRNEFPVRVVHAGVRKPQVRLTDLARYLAGEPVSRGRGRPPKSL